MANIAFHKAFIPVNNSDLSAKVILKTAELIKQGFVEKIALFSVWEADEIDYTKLHAGEKAEKLKANAQAVLDKYKAQFASECICAEYIRAGGDPAELIIETVENGDYDLIIMGSRKLSKAKELLFGSVSDRVTRLVDVPILLIK